MRKMKDSGIEWIGKIPESWSVHPAKYAFTEIREKNTDGKIQLALQFKNGSIIRKNNFEADSDDYVADTILNYTIVEPNTIMINGLNLNYDLKSLRVAIVREKGIITSAYLALKPDEAKISPEFANYLFKGYESKMAFHNMGAGIRLTLGFKEFKNQPVLFPETYEEQLAISAYLDRQCALIDSVTEKTKASIEEYKKLRQAVITQAVTKGVRGDRPMKDSGIEWIGEIPEDFVRRKLKSFADMISKGTTPKQMNNEFDDNYTIRFLKSENIVDQHLSSIPLFTITEETHTGFLSRSKLDERDILFVIAGASIGKCAIMDKTLLPANTNQATCFIRIQSKYIQIMRYLWYALQSNIMKTYISLFAVQSAQPNISMEDLGNFFIPLPKKADELSAIITYLDQKCAEIDALIAKKETFLTELESYKKSLIYEYVTGKKEVPQA